ncbi:pyruvate dehydrogenase (acetyl-transferring) E1 component subunit alpha [Neptuniibacter sp. QD72_48]|uniref:pyruvate dehydrogenase (acetyl-transferring) E1 component subunit alpha n=1 Tax=Neptuniibacter sp. QD72_48 TaxID=3398214 RepID=UPI0039F572CD
MTSPDKKIHLGKEHLSQLLYQMLRIRLFEERCAELYTQEKIRGFLHLYIGEEAIAVGVCQSLQNADRMVCTYREHGHALARGMSMTAVMAEMFGKTNGCSRGRGGSMHLFSDELNFYGGNAIVAGGLPLAVGLALADKKLQRDSVTCCFFGEGAVAEGEFHESLNLACLWQLPVLFICENNLYAMGTALERSESETELYRKAASYGMPAQSVNGMNVVDVEVAAKQALEAIRQGQGPQFLECRCYRFKGHSMFDTQLYRRKEEVEQWLSKGPVVQLSDWMEKNYHLSNQDIDLLKNKINLEIDQAVSEADQGEWEPVTDLLQGVYTEVDHD